MFGSKKKETTQVSTVGPELQRVLPQLDRPWYLTRHLLLLNLILLVPLFSSAAVGYDGMLANLLVEGTSPLTRHLQAP